MTAEEFAALVPGARRNPSGGYVGRCRAHDDQRASLSWRDGDTHMLLTCHAGCTFDAIATAFGVSPEQLRRSNGHVPGPPRRVAGAVYDYADERGALLYQAVRLEPKDFRCRRPDGVGGWTWNLQGVRVVPYRLPELAEARRVYIVEGEKDADALAALGLTATTNHGGAGKWRAEHTAALVAAAVPEVVILPDNDPAGEAHAAAVARSCLEAGLRVKRVELPSLPPKGDVSDWLATGHTATELEALADATPVLALGPILADGASASATRPAEAWPAPEPVPDDLPAVPAFDAARLLPRAFAPWVEDIAERAQCPPDFVAVAAVVATSAVVGRRLTLRPKRHDDWAVVPNLWGLVIGRPGIMKSPALHEALRPLGRVIADAREAHTAAMDEHEFRQAEAAIRRETVKAQLKDAMKRGAPTDELKAAFEATAYEAPAERRYLVNDATVEKLGALLNQNRNGLLLFRDELAGFLRTMEREGHENDRAFYCEAWNGSGSYTYDRIGRGTLHIEAACMSLLGGIQPGPLAAYLREAFGDGGDDGLIQRFQLLVYPDVALEWRNVDRWPDTDARRRVVELFQALDRLAPGDLSAHDGATPEERPFLRLTPEAQEGFDAWRAAHERLVRRGDEHPVVVSHLAKYRSLVPSLALLDHVVEAVDRGTGGPIALPAIERAVAWAAYLEAHARRVYESVTAGPRVAARALASKLRTGKLTGPFTAREILRAQWAGLTGREEITGALGLLESLHWLRPEHVPATGRGGRPTTHYHVNPQVVTK
jgi:putative DNA primase/helicase